MTKDDTLTQLDALIHSIARLEKELEDILREVEVLEQEIAQHRRLMTAEAMIQDALLGEGRR